MTTAREIIEHMESLQYAEQANNWDLVDLTAPKIQGHWLLLPTFLGKDSISKDLKDSKDDPKILIILESLDYKREILDSLAAIRPSFERLRDTHQSGRN